MPKSKIPSPSRSQGAPMTPRRDRTRRTRSVASPALSTVSGRLTSVIEHFKENNMESFALSPLNSRRSVLTDNTDIEEPRRRSWWKNLKENSRDIMEVLEDNIMIEDNQAFEELIDIEVLSQEQKDYTVDLPESSGSESINSIVLPQRKLFTQKDNQAKTKFGQLANTRESMAKQKRSSTIHDKTLSTGTKELFHATKRTKPVFPAGLLNITPNNTIADKFKELPAEPKQTKNIFGNRPTNKRKNMFANFIVSEGEDEVSEIQPKVFGFQKKVDQEHAPKPRSSNLMSDIDMDDWKHLPSSTMVEHQLEEMLRGHTPVKKARLESQEKEPNKSRKYVSKSFAKMQENVIDENMDESLENVHQIAVQLLEDADADEDDEQVENVVKNQKIREKDLNEDDAIDAQITDSDVENNEWFKNVQGKNHSKHAHATRQEKDVKDHVIENDNEALENHLTNEDANEKRENEYEIVDISQENIKKNEVNLDEDDATENFENKDQVNLIKNVDESVEIEHDEGIHETQDFNNGEETENEHVDQASANESQINYPENDVYGDINQEPNVEENDVADENDEAEPIGDVCQDVENYANGNVNNDENDVDDNERVENDTNNESQENEDSANESEVEDVANEANESDVEDDQQLGDENEVSANESEVEDDANEAHESDVENDQQLEDENEVSAHKSEVEDDANESDIENDQQLEDSDDADKAIASDEADPDNEQFDEIEVDEEDSQQLKYESDEEDRESNEEIEETPNTTHDTTGRNRKIALDQSPEVILRDKSNLVDSFTAQGNNTSIRKTMSKSLHIRPSMAPPPRESTGNSTGEGSGWDSHRTTRKTLRQTFGKDFTVRKSLRALVMEKSAARQTEHLEIQSESVNFPQANSTELPDESDRDVDEMVEEPDHEVSIGTRRNILKEHLQKIKQDNMEKRLKMREQIRNTIKAPARDPLNIFMVPTKPPPRRLKPAQKKQIKAVTPFGNLPQEVIEDLTYKPPKRFRPANASWITKRLYRFLEAKLESKYDYKARVRAEKLVETIYNFVKDIRRLRTAPLDATDALKHEMARLDIVKTHFEFYQFFHDYMPREVRIKVDPDIVNNIPVPRCGVFADILHE